MGQPTCADPDAAPATASSAPDSTALVLVPRSGRQGLLVPHARSGRSASRPTEQDHDVAAPPAGVDSHRWAAVWQHRPYLLAVARRRVGWHDAEDVVHEAVLRAIRDVLIPEARLRSWLVTTTVRLCADRHRDDASQRRRRLLHAARPENLVERGPEDDVCDAAEAVWVARQVDLLPGRQAEAVRLRAEGLSLAEVGAQMLGRARRVLRAAAAAGVTIWAGTRLVAKRKTQLHLVALGLGAACSAGVYGWEASQDVAAYSAHTVNSTLSPSIRQAEHWAWPHHSHAAGAHRHQRLVTVGTAAKRGEIAPRRV
jgi:RNA polymerase sigma factor (sigma-70 family)